MAYLSEDHITTPKREKLILVKQFSNNTFNTEYWEVGGSSATRVLTPYPQGSFPSPAKPATAAHASSLSTWDMEARKSGIQSHPWQNIKNEVNMEYRRPRPSSHIDIHMKKKKKIKELE